MSAVGLVAALVATSTGTGAGEAATTGGVAPSEVVRNAFQGHVLDGSGYVLPAGRWQVGLMEAKYGIFDFLDVGTSPYVWVLGPLLQGFAGNVSAKLGFRAGPVAAALEARYLFFDVERIDEERSDLTESRVSASVVPLTASVSVAPDAVQTYSFATRLVLAGGTADQSVESSEVAEGSAVSNAVHLILSGRWRLTRVFGLYARGYLQAWTQDIDVDGTSQPDPDIDIRLTASIDTTEDTGMLWSVLSGAHLIFGSVNLRVGAGYGAYFTPTLGLVLPVETVYPDFDLYVRF